MNVPQYQMSPSEHTELHSQVTDLLKKRDDKRKNVSLNGYSSSHGQEGWIMADGVDSHAINCITFNHRFPILRLDDMLDMLHGAKKKNSKIDLQSGHH